MIPLITVFAVSAAFVPLLTRAVSTRVFYLAALIPAAAFIWTVLQAPVVLVGGAVSEELPWIPSLSIAFSFRMDALAWILALVVTGVGSLVLLYCARYFTPREPSLGRIAALLLAFAGTMFGLVTADDLYILFTFWELTSVLSYLLIGHYTQRRESRGAALQALLVTTLGGLAMLVGLVLLQFAGSTTSISELVAYPPSGPVVTTAIMLILAGAVTKSALIPFHFWLPAAMAAPTPVSAYLHAAAMVKAGIYVVLRFAPGYADTPGWIPVLVSVGGATMIIGAWRAMTQNDLKLLLAYGTVSQLGFITVLAAIGTADTALAALALLVSHALFKATLFLIVGIIDHDEHTRDIRELSGLGRRRPVLAVSGTVAIFSMIGLPPLLGFVAKEGAFATLLEFGESGDPWGWIALVATVIGSILTVAYGGRFLWGAYGTKEVVKETTVRVPRNGHKPDHLILLAPVTLAVLVLVGGFFAPMFDNAFAAHAKDLGLVHYHLALWHGFEPALAISTGVIAVGALLFVYRGKVREMQRKMRLPLDAGRAYWAVQRTVDRSAVAITLFAQRGGLPQYLATILIVFVLGLGSVIALNGTWPDTFVAWDYPAQVFIAAAMCVAAVMAARATHRLAAVLLVGATGYGLVVLFAFHGAPDLALTQTLVETVTIVVFVLVLRRLPRRIAQHNRPVQRKRRALIGIAVGAVIAVAGYVALGARQWDSLGPELARLALLDGHGQNVVNVMLVDIRAWDTMNELSVLVVVATGVASLLFVSGRNVVVPRLRGSRERRRGINRAAPVRDQFVGRSNPADRSQAWLLGGRAMAPENRSIILEVIVRLVFHPAMVVSVFLLFAGHNSPGGGFAAGMLAGLALIMRYLAGGRYELGEAVPIGPGPLLGVGMLLATGTAVGSLFFGGEILQSAYFSWEAPVLGYLSFGTSTIFDIGVYLVVLGVVLDVLRSLGGEVDRQLAEGETSDSSDTPAAVIR